ncbi:2'-5' RNA ligase family protein [Brevundimonas sp.]|jgi:2'-5' RNA ligase|uniref:2'-5' RNA ligase family protein n=1 Tax=Brevundimonas sp. TaxID=1871086 RepID=UPI002EDA5E4A
MQGLFDFSEAQTIERLFVGLMLPAAQGEQAAEVRRRSRELYGLTGGEVRTDRLHVTLIHVGDYAGSIRADVAAEVSAVIAAMEQPSFVVSFDRVGSFGGAPGKHPHVLLGEDGLEALKAYRRTLWDAIHRRLKKTLSNPQFNPHVTLMYGDARLPERAVAPISWRAAEVELIHSEVGRSTYHTLGRWPLV